MVDKMKKVLSIILTCIVVVAVTGFPVTASTVSYNITKDAIASIEAKNYSSAYDYSEKTSEMVIEGGNVSFNKGDYVEYLLNVESGGLYTLSIVAGGAPSTVSVLDISVDGVVKLKQSVNHADWISYSTTETELYLPSGNCTLRITNAHDYGMYFSKILLSLKKSVNSIASKGTLTIPAKNYDSAFDNDTGKTEIPIEGGNVSYNTRDYVEYILDVQSDGLFSVGISGSGQTDTKSILDILIDGEHKYRQEMNHKGWSAYQTITSYIYIPSGIHTLRIYNPSERGFYLSEITVSHKNSILDVSDNSEYSAKNYMQSSISGMKRAGTKLVFGINTAKEGIYRLNIKSSRSTGAEIYVYSNLNFLNKTNVASATTAKNNYVFIKLKKGINIIKINITSGALYLSDISIAAQSSYDEALLTDVVSEIETAESSDELYNLIKENEDNLGINIDGLMSENENFDMVLIRMLGRHFNNSCDFFNVFYGLADEEAKSPSVSYKVSNGVLAAEIKTDVYKENGVLVLAIYDEGRLISTDIADFVKNQNAKLAVSGYAQGMEIKLLAFNSISKISPRAYSYGIFEEIFVSTDGNDETGDGTEDKPYKTIKKAKEKAETLKETMCGDIIINIASGTYVLGETENFDADNGGRDNYKIIYKGTDKENPPIISGGRKVIGWQKESNGIYSAPLEGAQVRDLYVGDYPAKRARSSYSYKVEKISDGDTVKAKRGKMPYSFAHPEDLVLVWNTYWASHYTSVDNVSYSFSSVSFKMGDTFDIKTGNDYIEITEGKNFYIENAMELLDEPGEFYHDYHAGKIYYMPYPEEDLTKVDVYVPNLERLINIEGSGKDSRVSNIVFDNISFRHGTWDNNDIIVNQADSYYTENGFEKIPFQIVVNYADNIMFENCEFACLGSGAITFADGVSNSKISGSIIRDVGGAGVSIGDFRRERVDSEDAICSEIEISDNVITRTSLVYRGTTAIAVYYENEIDILRNDISDLPYSGISVGWGWGEAQENFGYINVCKNKIDNVVRVLKDGGHIYTLGNIKGGVIEGNYMTGSENVHGNIYTDSGSQNLKILNNVCDSQEYWWFIGMYHVKDIYAEGNFSLNDLVNDSGENIVVKNHIEVPDGDFEKVAADIIDEAGVSDRYKNLLKKAEYPSWRSDTLEVLPQA